MEPVKYGGRYERAPGLGVDLLLGEEEEVLLPDDGAPQLQVPGPAPSGATNRRGRGAQAGAAGWANQPHSPPPSTP